MTDRMQDQIADSDTSAKDDEQQPKKPKSLRFVDANDSVTGMDTQMRNLNKCAKPLSSIIAKQHAHEIILSDHGPYSTSKVVADVEMRAVRLCNCKHVTYEFVEGQVILKLFISNCKDVKIDLRSSVRTSYVEIDYSSDIEVLTHLPISTVQTDELTHGLVHVCYHEPEYVGNLIHQNSPSLQVSIAGQDATPIGKLGNCQFISKPTSSGVFMTEAVERSGAEFPKNIFDMACSRNPAALNDDDQSGCTEQHCAELKRLEGNSAFRANDLLRAIGYYNESIDLRNDFPVVWANRAQCWLAIGDADKALYDAARCVELAPNYTVGWLRKGIALYVLGRYMQAISVLCEARRLDPDNSKVLDALEMAETMYRKHGINDA